MTDANQGAPKTVTPGMWSYKGWTISYNHAPIPVRDFDWSATSPDYDVDWDEDGFFRCGGEQVNAASYEDLLVAIEDAIACGDGHD